MTLLLLVHLLAASPFAEAGPVGPEARLLRLARETVLATVRSTPLPAVGEQTTPRPVFVTIERDGKVLGCRGSLECRSASLEEEVRLAARSAAAHDPRYRPLTPGDLPTILVTLTVVERLEPLPDQTAVASLAPESGLVLKCNGRTGVVLPWEGRDPSLRLKWAYRKARVTPGSPCRLFRLVATRVRG